MKLPENVIEVEVPDQGCDGCINLELPYSECIDLEYNQSDLDGMYCTKQGIIFARTDGYKLPSRSDMSKFITAQLKNEEPISKDFMKAGWHYGKQELRELLDFIYGGQPLSKKEELT